MVERGGGVEEDERAGLGLWIVEDVIEACVVAEGLEGIAEFVCHRAEEVELGLVGFGEPDGVVHDLCIGDRDAVL